jgi:hypothetical protein
MLNYDRQFFWYPLFTILSRRKRRRRNNNGWSWWTTPGAESTWDALYQEQSLTIKSSLGDGITIAGGNYHATLQSINRGHLCLCTVQGEGQAVLTFHGINSWAGGNTKVYKGKVILSFSEGRNYCGVTPHF